ncbi:hypothetical protein ACFX13_018095 [Malus domestica]
MCGGDGWSAWGRLAWIFARVFFVWVGEGAVRIREASGFHAYDLDPLFSSGCSIVSSEPAPFSAIMAARACRPGKLFWRSP